MVQGNGWLFGFRLTGFSLLVFRFLLLEWERFGLSNLISSVRISSGSFGGQVAPMGGTLGMEVLSCLVSSLSEFGELRRVLLPRRRPLSPRTQAGDGTWLSLVRVSAVKGSKGVIYGSWMVSLCASSLQSSSARPFSVML